MITIKSMFTIDESPKTPKGPQPTSLLQKLMNKAQIGRSPTVEEMLHSLFPKGVPTRRPAVTEEDQEEVIRQIGLAHSIEIGGTCPQLDIIARQTDPELRRLYIDLFNPARTRTMGKSTFGTSSILALIHAREQALKDQGEPA